MNIAVSSIMRLVTTVGILAAVYFLIVRPVLDTTEKISHDVNRSVTSGLNSANQALNQADIGSTKVRRRVRIEVHQAVKGTGHVDTSGLPRQAKRVLRCVQRAGTNVTKLQACAPG
jgi:hypothetical protein